MSEFKFACPVCGQHMMCNSSQGGSVMECPTCFQKIVAPQASTNAKFILTGQKYAERKAAAPAGNAAQSKVPMQKRLPVGIIVVAVAFLAALAIFIYQKTTGAWQTSDIGNVGATGLVKRTMGTFVINGSGADIWGQSDAFRFVYEPLNGDVTLTARIVEVQNTDPWAKAGVMIRESLNPDASHVLAGVSPANGILFQQRDRTANPASVVRMVPNQTAPCWLRLTRQGNIFSAYSSPDGKSWAVIGTTTIPMKNSALAGLAVCSHKAGTLCQAKFDNVSMEIP